MAATTSLLTASDHLHQPRIPPKNPMGSKWGHSLTVQPPPSVCKKPPDGDPVPFPELQDATLLAWSHLYAPHITPGIDFRRTYPLPPFPPPPDWAGVSFPDVNRFQTTVTRHAGRDNVDVHTIWLFSDFPAAGWFWFEVAPITIRPFELPLLMHHFGPSGGLVETRILE